MIKCAAIALCGSALCLLIKKSNPELSLALSLLLAVMLATSAVRLADSFKELTQTARVIIGTGNTAIAPILKCVAIAAVTKITGELCRDSNNASVAAAVELTGTMCAIGVAMPMVISMLKLIGEMI